MNITMKQRREAILAGLYQHGHVESSRLSAELGVSDATIRRDLKEMAEEGLLELNHGGAKLRKNMDYSFISKSSRNVEAKTVIAALAADLVSDGEQIFMDSGTTCFYMAGHIRRNKHLSVIVNSLRTAQELYSPSLNVLMLGGQYRPDRMDTIGPMASDAISRLRGYRAFIGGDGIDMEFGPSSVDIDSAHLFNIAVRNAKESILLADSSKFNASCLHKIMDWKMISTIVSEQKPADDWLVFFKEQQIKTVYPD